MKRRELLYYKSSKIFVAGFTRIKRVEFKDVYAFDR